MHEVRPSKRRLLRLADASDYLGGAVKPQTLRQWIWLRKIEYVHVGRNVCIAQDVLDRLIDENTVPALGDRY